MKFKTRKTAVAALVSSALFCSPFLAYAQDANEEVVAESKSKKRCRVNSRYRELCSSQ